MSQRYCPKDHCKTRRNPRRTKGFAGIFYGALKFGAGAGGTPPVHVKAGDIAAFPNGANRNFRTIEYDPALEQELTAPNESGICLNRAPADIPETVDANAILDLEDRLCAAYSIPRKRVLIHGMSMGPSQHRLLRMEPCIVSSSGICVTEYAGWDHAYAMDTLYPYTDQTLKVYQSAGK